MEEATRTTSRRSLLGRGLAFAAGAIGLGASGAQAATKEAARTELVLHGRSVHLSHPSKRAGQVPASGDRHSTYAELLDRPDGAVVGHFSAAHLTQASPFAAGASSLEIHTFTLEGGTIHGVGTVTRGAEGHFVVLGGTGRYAGVSGAYVARVGAREVGGDGTARFHFRLAR